MINHPERSGDDDQAATSPSAPAKLESGIHSPSDEIPTRISLSIPIQLSVRLGPTDEPQIGASVATAVENPTTKTDRPAPPDSTAQPVKSGRFCQDEIQQLESALAGPPVDTRDSTGPLTREREQLAPAISRPQSRTEPASRRSRLESYGDWLSQWSRDVGRALRSGVDEEALKSRVWFIESTFSDGVQMGTGVVLRLARDGQVKNMLLTCRHVVSDEQTGAAATSIRCWPDSSGYNPNTTAATKIWQAEPIVFRNGLQPTDFLRDGSRDWVLLDVHRQGQSFDAVPFAPGFAKPKIAFRQTYNPYRLVGFPGGNITMNRDVVKATISRSFRLTGTDAKPGQVMLKGPENTSPGFSGAPYFNSRGQVVAIHRGLLTGASTLTGVVGQTIEVELADQGWKVVTQREESWRFFAIRTALLVLGLLLGYAILLAARPDRTFDLVEGSTVTRFLDPYAAPVLPDETDKRNRQPQLGEGTGTIENGTLHYVAREYSELDFDDYVRHDQFNYPRRWLGWIPIPRGRVELKIREHIEFESVQDLYDALYGDPEEPYEQRRQHEDLRAIWQDPRRGPVVSIKLPELTEKGNYKWDNNGTIYFEQRVQAFESTKKIILKWKVGFRIKSPTSTPCYLEPAKNYRLEKVVVDQLVENPALNSIEMTFLSIEQNDPTLRETIDSDRR